MEVKSSIKRLLTHFLKHKGSYQSLEDSCYIVNQTPNAAIKIPKTKYKIKKLFEPSFQCDFFIECSECKQVFLRSSYETECCNKTLKTTNTNHFVAISLRQQLMRSIENNFEEIMSYNPTNQDGTIEDVHDGIGVRNAQKNCSHKILSLTANTDGAAVYRSVFNKSVWPLHLQQNFLLPNKRFKTSNILVAAIYFGPNQPKMTNLFYPLLNELNTIQKEGGITIERNGCEYVFMPVITHFCCDLPAKAKVQNITGHSGHYSCGYCLHPGISVNLRKDGASQKGSYIRYIYQPSPPRDHKSMLKEYKRVATTPILGIRGLSCMVAVDGFDLVYGYSIDYMHCVLLGVTKKLLELWFESKYHQEPFYIKKKNQRAFDQRLCAIRPLSDIGIRPLSIFNRSNFKAKTYRLLLLFYIRCCLPGLIDQKYVLHFELLSSAIFVLLREKVTIEDMRKAEEKLIEFVKAFEQLYGKENVTMNLHLLLHIVETVRYSGPLWSQSAFSFESSNGELIRSNNAKLNILQSMSWKYSIKPTVTVNDDYTIDDGILLRGKFIFEFSHTEKSLLESSGLSDPNDISTFKILKIRSRKFSSMADKQLNTIDFFIELYNGTIGAVKCFVLTKNNIYVLLEKFSTVESIEHIRQVETQDRSQIYLIKSIKSKLIYMQVRENIYVSSLPNSYEEN